MKRAMVLWVLSTILSAGVVLGVDAGPADALLQEADALYDRWNRPFDYAAYESDLRAAIVSYQEALPLIPEAELQTRSHVLVRLSQACFELAEGYLSDAKDVEAHHALGKDYALAALRLDPDFVAAEQESFRAALSGASDVGAIFWYGNTLGRYLEFHQLTAFMGGLRDIQACFERAMELDPAYMDGAPLRSLGSFYAQVPSFLGGDMATADALHQQAMAVSDAFLENRVNWADFVLRPQQNWAALCTVLNEVLAASQQIDIMAAWPFYNERAVLRARELLASAPCGG